jgi:hypothetical protein
MPRRHARSLTTSLYVDEARAADDDDLHVRPLPLSSSQHDVVPHGQRRWEIGFAQHLSKFDLDKATDLRAAQDAGLATIVRLPRAAL